MPLISLRSNNNLPSVIILVRPQLGSNIGAIARIMHNFSCSELRLVAPRPSWKDANAVAIAVGAVGILEKAKIYNDLNEAVADLSLLLAFTARTRYINKPSLDAKDLSNYLSSHSQERMGLMFGPENSGLSNEDLVFAHKMIHIATNPEFSSLNLAQAVAISLHELYEEDKKSNFNRKASPNATISELSSFFIHLEQSLDKTDFLRVTEKKADMLRNIKNIFSRIEILSSQEINTLRGIITALTHHN